MNKMFLQFLFAALLSIALTYQVRADDKLPSIRSFFSYDVLTSAVISPSGHYVAAAQRRSDGSWAVLTIDTIDPTKMNVISTANKKRIIEKVRWINDHRIYYSVWDSEIHYRLYYAVELDGSQLSALILGDTRSDQDQRFALWGEMNDGSDDVITESFMYNHNTLLNTRLYKLDSKTDKVVNWGRQLQPENVVSWLLDMNDFPRLAGSKFQLQCGWWYLPEKSDTWTALNQNGCFEEKGFIPFFLESDHNLYVTQNLNGFRALYNLDLKSMKLADEPLIKIKGFDISGSFEYDPRAKKILGLHYDSDAESTVWFDASLKAAQDKIDKLLPKTSNTLHCGIDCLNSPALLVIGQSDKQPSQYFIYSKSTGSVTEIGNSRPDIQPAQMGTRDFDHYIARDGIEIPVYVTLPPGKHGAAMPTVV